MLAEASERGAEIVIATDADEAGRKLAAECQALAPIGANLRREEPERKDWNDQLREQQRSTRRLDEADDQILMPPPPSPSL